MFDLFFSVMEEGVTLGGFMITVAVSLACGGLCALAVAYRSHPSAGFLVTLVLLPLIVSVVILMVNGNVGTGIAVMGAFSLVRFRSVAGRAKEIVAIFLSMTVGLANAAGYIGIALLLTLLVAVVMVLFAHFTHEGRGVLDLRITVPESLCFYDAFDDLFERYTVSHDLVSVKTASMGSLYKLQYRVVLKDRGETKAMIDALRCRNGNLEIALCESERVGDAL